MHSGSIEPSSQCPPVHKKNKPKDSQDRTMQDCRSYLKQLKQPETMSNCSFITLNLITVASWICKVITVIGHTKC
jgi:hypothetical protein